MFDIDTSIPICILREIAFDALKFGLCLPVQLVNVTALRACLAGVSGVDSFCRLTSFFSFVVNVGVQLRPCCVMNRFTEVRLNHALNIELFKNNTVICRDDIIGNSMYKDISLCGNRAVYFTELPVGFFPARAIKLLSRQCSIAAAKLFFARLVELRQVMFIALRISNKTRQTLVDSYNILRNRFDYIIDFNLQADKPFAIALGYSSGFDFALIRKFSVPANLNSARNADDTQSVPFEPNAIAESEFSGVKTTCRLESGKASGLPLFNSAKKCLVRFIQSTKYFLFCGMTELTILLIKSTNIFQVCSLFIIGNRFAGLLVSVNAFFQRSVVQIAQAPKHFIKLRYLIGIWIDFVFVRKNHSDALLILNVPPNSRFRYGTNGASEIASRPQGGQSGFETRELASEKLARPTFEPVNDFRNTPSRVRLNKQMNMIRHYLNGMNGHIEVSSNIINDFFKSCVNWINKHTSTIFWTPYNMIFKTENSPCICRVSAHAAQYTGGNCIFQQEHPIHPSAKADGPLEQI